jgi:hypothetical protein
MRWTIKERSFVQRLDERERDSVLGLSCQPHIDPVLISNDWWSRSHSKGITARTKLPSAAELASVALHATSRSDKLSQLFMSAFDEPLSVAMRDLLAFSAVVENGYD